MVQFSIKKFTDLNIKELHDAFALRSEVFVVEQNCIYQDIDGKDTASYHVLGKKEDTLVAYARILEKGVAYTDFVSIGRIVVSEDNRGAQFGHLLVRFCTDQIHALFPTQRIKISAQAHLESFYNQHGFEKTGDTYLEDGIPHIAMIKQ